MKLSQTKQIGNDAQADRRTAAFAERHFGGCPAHRQEAVAVYCAIEFLSEKIYARLAPDSAISEVVAEPNGSVLGKDSLDTVELLMTIEEEMGRDLSNENGSSLWKSIVLCRLLGPNVKQSTWTSVATQVIARLPNNKSTASPVEFPISTNFAWRQLKSSGSHAW